MRTTAFLYGEIMPNSLSSEYWFDYKEVGGAERQTPKQSLSYTDESWHDIEEEVTGLKSCALYEVTLVAKKWMAKDQRRNRTS